MFLIKPGNHRRASARTPDGLPRPPRVARDAASDQLPLMLLSFMSESRRLDNTRMKKELKVRLHYPHVRDGLSPQGALFSGAR